jgi:hypothetical protein
LTAHQGDIIYRNVGAPDIWLAKVQPKDIKFFCVIIKEIIPLNLEDLDRYVNFKLEEKWER